MFLFLIYFLLRYLFIHFIFDPYVLINSNCKILTLHFEFDINNFILQQYHRTTPSYSISCLFTFFVSLLFLFCFLLFTFSFFCVPFFFLVIIFFSFLLSFLTICYYYYYYSLIICRNLEHMDAFGWIFSVFGVNNICAVHMAGRR